MSIKSLLAILTATSMGMMACATYGNSAASGTVNTVATIINDMTLPHDSLPHNNPYVSASSGVVEAGLDGAGYKALSGWGEVCRDVTDSKDRNTKVELRNFRVFVLSKSTGQWKRLSSTPKVSGRYYPEDWSNAARKDADIKDGTDGGISVKLIHGYLFHYWPDTSTKSNIVPVNVDDIGGIFTSIEARLVVDDPHLKDDRATAKYVVEVGADYYSDAKYTGTGKHLEIGGGRYKFVTNDWRAFNFITLDQDDILANSPPLD